MNRTSFTKLHWFIVSRIRSVGNHENAHRVASQRYLLTFVFDHHKARLVNLS